MSSKWKLLINRYVNEQELQENTLVQLGTVPYQGNTLKI